MIRPEPALAAVLAVVMTGPACRSKAETEATDEARQPTEVAVTVGKVVRATLRAYATGFGTVDAEPAVAGRPPASAKIGSPVSGLIADALAVEGQKVERGATLFQLDSRVADVQVEKARQALEFADRTFERQKKLLAIDATSQKLYQEAEAGAQAARYELANAQAQRALLTIRAPIAGTITRVLARPGDSIDSTTVLAEVVDLDRLVASARIRSIDAALIRRGQRAEVVPGRPEGADQARSAGPSVAATVSYVSVSVDQATDTVQVRAVLPRQSALKPGQFVTLRILYDEHRDRLAVPIESIVPDEAGHGAFLAIVAGNVATKYPVTVGLKDQGLVEVEGPDVREGTAIVASGAYGLPEKTRIRPIAN